MGSLLVGQVVSDQGGVVWLCRHLAPMWGAPPDSAYLTFDCLTTMS